MKGTITISIIKGMIVGLIFGLFVLALIHFMPNKKQSQGTTKNEIGDLSIKIDSLQKEISAKIDSIKIINEQKTYIKKYYENVSAAVDTIKTDTALVAYIRGQLQSLGAARFQ